MTRPHYIPDDPEIAVVETMKHLFAYQRQRHESMILCPRPITGCFNDLAIWLLKQNPQHDRRVYDGTSIISTYYKLEHLDEFAQDYSMTWKDEMALIRNDMRTMQACTGIRAELRVIPDEGYHPETYVFHQDGGSYKPLLKDTDKIICAYTDPVTECLLTADAQTLSVSSKSFPRFSKKAGAKAFRPGVGDVWRQTSIEGGKALVHRAVPITVDKSLQPWEGLRPWNPPRLLAVC